MRWLSLEELIIFPPVSHWLWSSPYASACNHLYTWSSLSLDLKVPGGGISMFSFILFSWHLAWCLVSQFICLGEERWMWHKKSAEGLWGFLRDKILCWVCCSGRLLCLGSRRCFCPSGSHIPQEWMELDLGLESPFAVPFPLKLSVDYIQLTLRYSILLWS